MAESVVETELTIPGSEYKSRPSVFALSYKDQIDFELLTFDFERDEITEAISNHTYSFPPEFDLLPALVRPGERVLDLGAHIGTFALLAATMGFEVAAVEASSRNSVLLQASAKRNYLANLTVFTAAISDRRQTLDFIQAGPYGLVATPLLEAPSTAVPAMSVDDLVSELGWDRVAFVKMDVEGSEVKAIAGMKELLAHAAAPILLFEANGHTLHYYGETPKRLLAALEAYGYRSYLVEAGKLIPLRSKELLFNCTVDCLATKDALPMLPGWRLCPPFTRVERIFQIRAMACHPQSHLRAYIARTLAAAPLHILADYRVVEMLEKLHDDPELEVRAGLSWYTNHWLRRAVQEKSLPAAILRALHSLHRWRNREFETVA